MRRAGDCRVIRDDIGSEDFAPFDDEDGSKLERGRCTGSSLSWVSETREISRCGIPCKHLLVWQPRRRRVKPRVRPHENDKRETVVNSQQFAST